MFANKFFLWNKPINYLIYQETVLISNMSNLTKIYDVMYQQAEDSPSSILI